MKIIVQIDQKNRPRCCRYRHKYTKYKECLGKMMSICITQWGSIHENVKQNWGWDEKSCCL